MTRRICVTYAETTPESAQDGDFSDHGWENEDGVSMEPDDFDAEEGVTAVDKAERYLRSEGPIEPSSWPEWHPGVWYSGPWVVMDYRTGTERELSFHPKGFTEAEERELFARLKAKP